MKKKDQVLTAIDNTLKELDALLIELNHHRDQLINLGIDEQAGQLTDQIEALHAFQANVIALRDEWRGIDLTPPSTNLEQETIPNIEPTHAQKQGLRTPNQAFQLPILQALIQLSGSAPIQIVLDRVHEMMKDQLNDYDYQSLPSNPHVVRWENNAQWARFKLVNEGYLASDSPRGIWEITEAGRERVGAAELEMDYGEGDGGADYHAQRFDFTNTDRE